MKVVFATPTVQRPIDPFFKALEASIPILNDAGWVTESVYKIGNPYISAARAFMTRQALDAKADVIVYLDHDISWKPHDLLDLLNADADVVAGTYRFKKDEEEYMGAVLSNERGTPLVEKGMIRADRVPAGFLKVTPDFLDRYMTYYPELCFGKKHNLSVDLFNHGAIDGVWYGEDYAFSKRTVEMGENIYILPNLSIDHYQNGIAYKGNFHNFLRKQPGGDLSLRVA